MLLCVRSDLCSDYRQDQDVCAAVLLALLPSVRSLGGCPHPPEDLTHVRGMLLHMVSGFWSVSQEFPLKPHLPSCIRIVPGYRLFCVCPVCSYLSQTGKCVAPVRVALVRCLVALLEVSPHQALRLSGSFWILLMLRSSVPGSPESRPTRAVAGPF